MPEKMKQIYAQAIKIELFSEKAFFYILGNISASFGNSKN